MAKPVPQDAYQAVMDAIARAADGMVLAQIEAQLPNAPTRRTLQRWLVDLIAQQRLRKSGQGRGTRYWTAGTAAQWVRTLAQTLIPLSAPARDIEAQMILNH